jgi:hypothetical protein
MLHCVIVAQLMLDFTIKKQKNTIRIWMIKPMCIMWNLKPWLGYLQWGPTWTDSTLSLCCDTRGFYNICHSFVGSVVCVGMFDPMGSLLCLHHVNLCLNITSSQACMFRNKRIEEFLGSWPSLWLSLKHYLGQNWNGDQLACPCHKLDQRYKNHEPCMIHDTGAK